MNGNLDPAVRESPSSAYITEALRKRPRRAVAAVESKRAIQKLASAMSAAPSTVLPRFVGHAMELTGTASAGLSLYEPDPLPGVFRWRHLHGSLKRFEGIVTPAGDNPSAVALDRNQVTLSSHPERVYGWMAAAALELPEVLLVPLHVAKEEPFGTLWVVANEAGEFQQGHAEALAELADFARTAIMMIRKEEDLRSALDEQELLAREMNHRLKNLFAMTQGMIRGSARNAESVKDMTAALSGRLQALANAHSMVQGSVGSIGSDAHADLRSLIGSIVGAHETSPRNPRIHVRGAAISCGAHAINAMALVVHELATNAAKYGALSVPRGRVDVSWSNQQSFIIVKWRERDGPSIGAPPRDTGFGSWLISRTVEGQLRGAVEYDWRPAGLCVALRIPATILAQ